jgi:hypothetical protein
MGEVKMEQKWRHGDVYGIQSDIDVAKLRMNGTKLEGKESNVLAYGEVTGHMHEITADPCLFQRFELEGKKYLVVLADGGVAIEHAEHGTGIIPKGVWEERIDREFDYMTHQFRNVLD